MVKKILGIVFVSFFLAACFMNYSDRAVYSPQAPDKACGVMASILEDLGYKVTDKNEAPDRYITSKPYIRAEKSLKEPDGKIMAHIEFIRIQGETHISIHLDWIGKSQIKDYVLKNATADIADAFEVANK